LALAGQDTSENGVVTYMPKFPGGDAALLKFIHDNLKYPAEAVKQKIQGRVTVQFTVAKDGSVCDAHILRSLSPILDAEALRVVNMMPAFQPGRLKNGEAAQVKYCVPVTFSLMAGKKVFR
jgi:TonB family protein